MLKEKIAVNPEKCTECMSCQLICSLTYAGGFNPEKASIAINPPLDIHFTDECKEGCVRCTEYCVYGAIARIKE
jgi:TPP-dependent indolepyruvate ferredoxin oxidoreductase alpha subunit